MIRVVLSAATGGVNGLAALFADPADAEANAPESVIAALSKSARACSSSTATRTPSFHSGTA